MLLSPKLLHPIQGLDVGSRARARGVRVRASSSAPAQQMFDGHHAAVQCPRGAHECGRPACHSQASRCCSHARSGAQCRLAEQRKRSGALCSRCRFCSPGRRLRRGRKTFRGLGLGHLLAHELLAVSGCRPLHLLGPLARSLQQRLHFAGPADDLRRDHLVRRWC